MIRIPNINICSFAKAYVPKTWAQTAGLACAAIAGAYFLKQQFFPSQQVKFSNDIKVHTYTDEGAQETLSGFLVHIPGEKNPRIVILEQIQEDGVVIRFQNDKETVEPTDSIFLHQAVWKAWKGKKLW